jgi:hypothetical protein
LALPIAGFTYTNAHIGQPYAPVPGLDFLSVPPQTRPVGWGEQAVAECVAEDGYSMVFVVCIQALGNNYATSILSPDPNLNIPRSIFSNANIFSDFNWIS